MLREKNIQHFGNRMNLCSDSGFYMSEAAAWSIENRLKAHKIKRRCLESALVRPCAEAFIFKSLIATGRTSALSKRMGRKTSGRNQLARCL
jgi:hypothetical protein